MAELTLKPIGFFHGPRVSKTAVPRQGYLSQQQGHIEFTKGFDFKLALTGLEKMSHVWVIYHFHKAELETPKPLVRPPRNPDIQVGVWATRAPYRPNSIGLTLAQIDRVEEGKLYLSQVDLLDETPILDLKPYNTESDVAINPRQGWIDEVETWSFRLEPAAEKQLQWLKANGLEEIEDVLEHQFGTPPLQLSRKRVRAEKDHYILSYRTWRISFSVDEENRSSLILKIQSGYSDEELSSSEDPYQDKDLHRKFGEFFKS